MTLASIADAVAQVFAMMSSALTFFASPIGLVIVGLPVAGVIAAIIAKLIPRR